MCFHWNNWQLTLHPMVTYYNNSKEMKHQSIYFISDYMNHYSIFVYAFQIIVIDYVKELLPQINKVIYFSDDCAAPYKNCNWLCNWLWFDCHLEFLCHFPQQKCLWWYWWDNQKKGTTGKSPKTNNQSNYDPSAVF